MKTGRLGCLTFNGLAAAAVTALFVSGFALVRGGSLFSPGLLNDRKGEPLGGVSSHFEITACSTCHPAFWSGITMSDLCLECHTEVQQQVDSGEGIHSVFAQDDPFLCQDCHTEHQGIDASITFVDTETFPHEETGFSLGSHQELDGRPFYCQDCHDPTSHFDTYDCTRCHTRLDDTFVRGHTQTFGESCLNCHDGLETYGENFDHSVARFPLEGKHASLECSACHQGQQSIDAIASTPATCAGCHLEEDAHEGKFGVQCEFCHTPEGWERAEFDHDVLDFKLVGKHEQLECSDCHADLTFEPMPHTCFDCHAADDEHDGKYGTACEQCHTPVAWDAVTFDHAALPFPLVGKHLLLDCSACHESYIFSPMPHTCADCHLEDDAHAGELGTTCERCHTPEDWSKIIFDHSTSTFPLTGKHIDVSCVSCHTGGRFKGLPATCVACHARDDAHNGDFGSSCELCHIPDGWGVIIFNHAKTAFPLTGAHSRLNCMQCHTQGVPFASTPTACAACHSEPAYHAGLFGTNCASCHSTSAWVPASFNEAHTFPISHGGAGTCRSCHPSSLTGYTCYSCHSLDSITAKHQEEGITNLSDCVGCHPTGQKEDGGGGDDGGDD